MDENDKIQKIKKLEEEEAMLIMILHFHNINRNQTSFGSNREREEHIDDILDNLNDIRQRLKELKNDHNR